MTRQLACSWLAAVARLARVEVLRIGSGAAADLAELSGPDVSVLHSVTHWARDKCLADLCFVLNVEDTHLVNYALKKLLKLGLVARAWARQGNLLRRHAQPIGRPLRPLRSSGPGAKSHKSCWAALCPGRPVTKPPGQVPAPEM